MDNTPDLIEEKPSRKLKLAAIELMVENYDTIIYHTISFGKRISNNLVTLAKHEKISSDEMCQLEAALWLYTSMFGRFPAAESSAEGIQQQQHDFVERYGRQDLTRAGFKEADVTIITNAIKNLRNTEETDNRILNILRDALIMDFIGKNGKERLEKFYQEAILNDAKLSMKDFYGLMIDFLTYYQPHSKYSQTSILPKIQELILTLEKERKKLDKRKDIALKKELDINEEELKQLRKNLRSINGRDARGVQTLFRTTSHNHYTLNEMVDRKANIMITVNSIILSVVISGLLGFSERGLPVIFSSIFILSIASFLSIIFAIVAITPNRTQGRFTLDEIRNKNGNLLYFGNFHNMSFKDYEWGMLQKLNDSDFLYSSMIKDLYFLGKALHRKYRFIRLSLGIFMAGLVASFGVSLIIRFFVM